MNLIGYGLAKFDIDFAKQFGFSTKSAFARYLVSIGLANTEKAVSNRQDSFDPYFDNGRKGWHQRNQREHIKLFIDSLFGTEDVIHYANLVKLYIQDLKSDIILTDEKLSPTNKTKFKQLQETGKEAEFYFMNNYQSIPAFNHGILEDARLLGDGYDFQIQQDDEYFLAEVKGIRDKKGSIRLTKNEFNQAKEYRQNYFLVIVSNLNQTPKLSYFENPLEKIQLTYKEQITTQIHYHSGHILW